MACSQPFYRYNETTHSFVRIPCGWCMSCRIDRRNYFSDRFEYSFYKEFNGIGSFTTITYDDNHIPLSADGKSFTLKKSDSIKFLKRIRSYMNYHKINNPFLNSKFKFFCAGEYGESTNRPHLHFLFCGLDYSAIDEVIKPCWKNGIIVDNGPILPGGIKYVMKYLDKQQHGEALDKYLDLGIEPPFIHCSHKMAKGLYDTNEPFYEWHGKKRPLPIWIRNKRLIPSQSPIKQYILEYAHKHNMTYDEADYVLRRDKDSSIIQQTIFNNEPVTYSDSVRPMSVRSELRKY